MRDVSPQNTLYLENKSLPLFLNFQNVDHFSSIYTHLNDSNIYILCIISLFLFRVKNTTHLNDSGIYILCIISLLLFSARNTTHLNDSDI